MGCKFSILECIRGKVEQEKSISSETRSSLVTSDATETDRDEESPYLAFDKCRFVAEEDNHKVAKHKTDVLDIVDKKYEKSFFEDVTHDENGDYLTIKEERPYGSARINRSKREANFLHGEYLIKGYNNTISQSNLLQMKDQVKIRFYENATNVKKCPRARRRAKIYKPLESTYLDKGEPKGPQDFSNYLLTTTVPSIVKILLVFSKDDQQMDMLATAARRLGWSVSVAKDAEKAIELFQNRAHELVIIDRRGHHAAEGDVICRTIRSSPMYYNSIIIALVKKSYFMLGEKDHIVALNLLETGFSRALIECSHEGILINELVGIYTSSLLPRTQLSAAHALYVALDRCRDMVHVTNDKNIIQFLNKISEKLLGYKTEEMMGRNLSEIIYYENFALMEQQLSKGREFEGNINCRRKNNQMITINCRIIPFCTTLKKPTHYIYVYDTTYLSDNSVPISPVGSPSHPPFKTSVLSNTRKSSDVKSGISEGRRPSSLQKLHTLQLEAPITKVITLLSNAVTDTNPETAAQISEAINILKTTELYVPHLKEDKTYSDPVATDLVGALLASPRTAWESRRSSSDSARLSSIKAITSPVSSRIQMNNFLGPHEIAEILDRSLNWNFEIFKLEVLTEKRPLVFLGLTIMNLYQVPAKLNCDEKTLQNWLAIIEHNYNGDNSYHNSTHAADVMQATARFMQSKRLKEILEPLDEVAALIAAAAHDIDHPGRSSQFLCNANNRLAILYNDLSVLESHHAALTFKLSLSDDSVNIFKNLEQDAYKLLRQNVIDMILATEMTKHFEHLAKFMNVCSTRIGDGQETYSDSLDMSVILQPDNVILVKRMMIKCADVSNPTRPLKCCVEWARRIAEEYFNQTDEEKKLRLPVVMPMFDRLTCSIPKSQIGFVDYIINDMIEAWDVFIDMPEMVGYMRHNYEKWKEYNEKGISTLQDVEKLQQHPDMQIPRSS